MPGPDLPPTLRVCLVLEVCWQSPHTSQRVLIRYHRLLAHCALSVHLYTAFLWFLKLECFLNSESALQVLRHQLLQATAYSVSFWSEFRHSCLDPLLRALDVGRFGPFEVSFVAFHGWAPHSSAPVEMTGWTRDVSVIGQKLDAVSFDGGGPLECNHSGECSAYLCDCSICSLRRGAPCGCSFHRSFLCCCLSSVLLWPARCLQDLICLSSQRTCLQMH